MVCSTFLEEINRRVHDLISRTHLIERSVTLDQLNWKPGSDLWSIGQVYDHMNLADAFYFAPMERAVEFGRYGKGTEVRHSFVGGFLIKASGPAGNAPVPSKLVPGKGPFDVEVFHQFATDLERVRGLAKSADDVDLSKTPFRSPLLPLLKLNLADAFELLAGHGERHVGQVEQLMRRADFPK